MLSRRQELPAEAFLSLAALKAGHQQKDEGLRIIVLSYGMSMQLERAAREGNLIVVV